MAAGDQRSKKEIAVRNVIDAVRKNVSFDRAPVNKGIHLGVVGRSNDQYIAVQIGSLKTALNPFELVVARQVANLDACLESHHPQLYAGREQAADLVQSDPSGAHQQAVASIEFEKDRQHAHDGKPQSATPCGTRPAGRSRSTGASASPARCARNWSSEWRLNQARRFSPGLRLDRYWRSSRSMDSGTSVAGHR